MLRNTAPLEIAWATADQPANLAQTPRHEITVGQMADAYAEIDVRLRENHRLIREDQPDIHVRISRKEIVNDRRNMQPPKAERRGYDQLSPRRTIFTGSSALGIIEIVKQPSGRAYELLARFGEHETPACSDEQLRPQMLLKVGYAPADGRQRYARALGRTRKAALVHSDDKTTQGFKSIHTASRFMKMSLSKIAAYFIFRKCLFNLQAG
jgi:hypothetical protein